MDKDSNQHQNVTNDTELYDSKEYLLSLVPENSDSITGKNESRIENAHDLDLFVEDIIDDDNQPIQLQQTGTSFTFTTTQTNEEFSLLRQGKATNELTKIYKSNSKIEINKITGNAIITTPVADCQLSILNYEAFPVLRTTIYQLLDAIITTMTKKGTKSPEVILSFTDYMNLRGLRNRKEARKQVADDLDVLRQLSITWNETKNGVTSNYAFLNIAESGSIIRDNITFTFSNKFFDVLSKYPIMPYPNTIFKINSNKNPNSYGLLRKISEHKRMNLGKPNENTISVETLLKCCPTIPTYEEVISSVKS